MRYKLGDKRLKSGSGERYLGIWVHDKLNMSQQCPGSQVGQLCPGIHPGKGGACPSLLFFEPHSLRTRNYCFVPLGEEKAAGKRGSRVGDADVSADQWKGRRDGNEIVSGGIQIGHMVVIWVQKLCKSSFWYFFIYQPR